MSVIYGIWLRVKFGKNMQKLVFQRRSKLRNCTNPKEESHGSMTPAYTHLRYVSMQSSIWNVKTRQKDENLHDAMHDAMLKFPDSISLPALISLVCAAVI